MAFYVRGFLILFVIVSVLLHLPPGKSYQKYIRFFAEFVLTLALLTPVLSLFGDSDRFLELIAYEEFTEELAQISQDMQQVEYLYGDYHKEAYEQAIAEDAARIAQGHGFAVQECTVKLSEEYEVERIFLVVSSDGEADTISRIVLDEAVQEETGDVIFTALREELMDFYKIGEAQLSIQYGSGQGG